MLVSSYTYPHLSTALALQQTELQQFQMFRWSSSILNIHLVRGVRAYVLTIQISQLSNCFHYMNICCLCSVRVVLHSCEYLLSRGYFEYPLDLVQPLPQTKQPFVHFAWASGQIWPPNNLHQDRGLTLEQMHTLENQKRQILHWIRWVSNLCLFLEKSVKYLIISRFRFH